MYNMTASYTVTSTLHGKHVAHQEFSDKTSAAAWFKASTTDEMFGEGWKVVLRHRGKVIKQKVS